MGALRTWACGVLLNFNVSALKTLPLEETNVSVDQGSHRVHPRRSQRRSIMRCLGGRACKGSLIRTKTSSSQGPCRLGPDLKGP